MPGRDFCDLVDQILRQPGTALRRELFGPEWGYHEENTARLYEALAHTVKHDWIDRITDPEDPEVKRERAEAKRSGRKPPERPVLEPVALRPPEWADRRAEQWLQEIEAATKQPGRVERRFLSTAEFEAKFC